MFNFLQIFFSSIIFSIVLRSDKVLCASRALCTRISRSHAQIPPRSEIGQWMKSDLRKSGKLGKKTPDSKINAQKSENLRTCGPTPVATTLAGWVLASSVCA